MSERGPRERWAAVEQAPRGVARLVALMQTLRAPDGCPWDREQSHRSLARYLIEECYELVDAIESGDDAALLGELGDVLLQVVFHAQIAREEGRFDLDDVAEAEVQKMHRRHPHVFAEARADSAEDVRRGWEQGKRRDTPDRGLADGVPRAMPALIRAQTISARAAGLGFDWLDLTELRPKLDEELAELDAELQRDDRNRVEDELGDVLFVLVNLARKLDIDAEAALQRATDKFSARFDAMERPPQPRSTDPLSARAWDEAWTRAKRLRDEAGPPSS